MQQLIDYFGHHPYLAAAAVAAFVIVAIYEIRTSAQSFASLSAMQAVRLMNQGALVLDVRTRERYDAGHIGDARNIPVALLESEADGLKKWRDKTVITYCDTGRDAAAGARTLSRLGFTKVSSLDGGINAWIKDNMPLNTT